MIPNVIKKKKKTAKTKKGRIKRQTLGEEINYI